MAINRDTWLRAGALAGAAFMATCHGGGDPGEQTGAKTGESVSASISSANLLLQELNNSCGTNQAQKFFQVKNNGTASVTTSDVTIKFWVDDVSAAAMQAAVYYGGCLTNASGCFHQVSGVNVSVAKLSTACGPTPSSQANWEVTITNTDHTAFAPGVLWSNLQAALHLSNYGNFNPGTADWYSGCLSGSGYVNPPHSAVYVQGNLVTASAGVPPSCVAPHGTQPVAGPAAPAVVNGTFPLVGPVPPSTTINLAISLPLRNNSNGELDAFIASTQDPTNPLFHQYLTPAGFAAAYGPSQSDYDAVGAWAVANGLTVTGTYTSRALINVSGTAAAVEQALFVTLNQYARGDGTTFYAPANDPSPNLSVPILSIAGLDTIAVPQPLGGTGPAYANCPTGSGDAGTAYTGSDFRKAYLPGLPGANDGSGQTVAIVAFDGFYPCDNPGSCSPGFVSDTQSFANQKLGSVQLQPQQIVVNLPPATTVSALSNGLVLSSCTNLAPCTLHVGSTAGYPLTGVLTVGSPGNLVSYTGTTGTSFTGCSGGTGTLSTGTAVSSPLIPGANESEVAMDVELVASVAPGLATVSGTAINVYEWEHNGTANVDSSAFPTVLTRVANDNTAQIVSNTWVWQGTGSLPEAGIKNTFRQLAAQGQTFIQAAGDTGAYVTAPTCGTTAAGVPSPIVDSPYMLVVGGTQLTTDGSQGFLSESVWNNSANGSTLPAFGASGGGQASCYVNGVGTNVPTLALPLWQQPVNGTIGATARMIPDVSIAATQIGAVIHGQPAYANGGLVPGSFNSCMSGTSASASLWAGVAALINQQTPKTFGSLGFANPRIYNIAQSAGNFRDVTSGNNTLVSSGATGTTAGVGFDLASGLGSPNTQLIGASLPVQSCQSGSNLSVVVNSATQQVIAYTPNGSWGESATGIMAIELEAAGGGAPSQRTMIGTGDQVNTCAGDSSTGHVICVGNNNHIYFIQGTTLLGTMSSNAASGSTDFSGGSCTTCNVAVDPVHHKAWISMALLSGGVGVQSLDINTAWTFLPGTPPQSVLGATAVTLDPSSTDDTLAEAIGVDPGVTAAGNVVLSPNESNNYQIVNVSSGTVYNNTTTPVTGVGGIMDSAAEDCSTGIILASVEFSNGIYLADLQQASFGGTTWSTPGQSYTSIPELSYPNYGSPAPPTLGGGFTLYGTVGGVAVSSNKALHLGIMANEFGGSGFIVFQLPSTAGPTAGNACTANADCCGGTCAPATGTCTGVGACTPQLVDYVAAGLPSTPVAPWQMGWDPHTIGVYTSPNTGRQLAIFQNDPNQDGSGARDYLALVDMEKLLTVVPRTAAHTVDPAYDLVANHIVTFIQDTP